MELLEIVGLTAIVITIVAFLSGAEICVMMYRKGSAEGISLFPLMASVLCCSLWLNYGFQTADKLAIFVNVIGLALNFIYVCFYYLYTKEKDTANTQLTLLTSLLVAVYGISQYSSHGVTISGTCASASNFVFIGAQLLLITKVIKSKSTESLPFLISVMSLAMGIVWGVLGVLINDIFLIVPNLVGGVVSTVQLLLFTVYPKKVDKKKKRN